MNPTRPLASFALAALFVSSCGGPSQPSETSIAAAKEAARAAADRLGQELVAALGEALGKGGPVSAIEVCQLRAPQIAADVGAAGKVKIGRTALRVRNPANAPDAWERAGLESFAQARAGGADLSSWSATSVEATADGFQLRWLRPIVLQPACTVCHGEELAPELVAELAKRYPQDAATGFKPGELRGAFTATVQLDG